MYINKSNKNYKPLPVEFGEVRGHVEMPRNVSPTNQPPECVIRSVWTSYNDLSSNLFTQLIPVGGVAIFDIYRFGELFPQHMKDWTVRQLFDTEKTLTSLPYPDPKCIKLNH
jgi:hypothetical protein